MKAGERAESGQQAGGEAVGHALHAEDQARARVIADRGAVARKPAHPHSLRCAMPTSDDAAVHAPCHLSA